MRDQDLTPLRSWRAVRRCEMLAGSAPASRLIVNGTQRRLSSGCITGNPEVTRLDQGNVRIGDHSPTTKKSILQKWTSRRFRQRFSLRLEPNIADRKRDSISIFNQNAITWNLVCSSTDRCIGMTE